MESGLCGVGLRFNGGSGYRESRAAIESELCVGCGLDLMGQRVSGK